MEGRDVESATRPVGIVLDHARARGYQNAQGGSEDFNLEAITSLEANRWRSIGGEVIRLEPGGDRNQHRR